MPCRRAILLLAVAAAGCGSGHARHRAGARRGPAWARDAGTDTAPGRARPGTDAAVAAFARRARPVYCGGRERRLVALTFDDGPGPYTGMALRELRRAGARATFFLVGRSIQRFPQWPRRERRLGAIGEHTLTHPYLPGLAPGAARHEIAGGQAAAAAAAGVRVRLFRPPYGAHTPAIDRLVARLGMVEVLWDVDSTDSRVAPPSNYATIASTVRHGIRPGSIVLFHENRGQTIRALRTILPMLSRRRLRAVTVPQLLRDDPPSRIMLARGWAGCDAPPPAAAAG